MTRKDFVLIAGAIKIALHPDSTKCEIQGHQDRHTVSG